MLRSRIVQNCFMDVFPFFFLKETPTFVGSNTETEGCILTPIGENLFSALE